jgi:hypothetical protein
MSRFLFVVDGAGQVESSDWMWVGGREAQILMCLGVLRWERGVDESDPGFIRYP